MLKGSAVSIASAIAKVSIQVLSTAVLARLISPSDFGLFAMSFVLTGFLFMLAEAGLSAATIQIEAITKSAISTLFYLNAIFSTIIFAVCVAAAPLFGRFYSDERIEPVVVGLALAGAIASTTAQYVAVMQRERRWGTLQGIQIASLIVGAVAGAAGATVNLAYWALVVQQLATATSAFVLLALFSSWSPAYFRLDSEVRNMLRFGAYMSSINFLNYWIRKLDDLLIGRFLGAADLGVYSRAYQLVTMPIALISGPMAGVLVPLMSSKQKEARKWATQYLEGLNVVMSMSALLSSILIMYADVVIEVLLGSAWREAGDVFKVLSITILFQPLLNSMGWIYHSLARGRDMLVFTSIAGPVYLLAFVCGVQFGMLGVAWGYAGAVFLLAGPSILFAIRGTVLTARSILWAAGRPVVAAGLAGAAVSPFIGVGSVSSRWGEVLAVGASYVTLYAILLSIFSAFGSERRSTVVHVLYRLLVRKDPETSRE